MRTRLDKNSLFLIYFELLYFILSWKATNIQHNQYDMIVLQLIGSTYLVITGILCTNYLRWAQPIRVFYM